MNDDPPAKPCGPLAGSHRAIVRQSGGFQVISERHAIPEIEPELTIREVLILMDALDGDCQMCRQPYFVIEALRARGLLRYGWSDGVGTVLRITPEGENELYRSPLYRAD